MTTTSAHLREHAVRIWTAGVQAVRSAALIEQKISWTTNGLLIDEIEVPLTSEAKIEVVGAGKAGAGMSTGLLHSLASEPARLQQHRLSGWINVPADCVRSLDRITLHAARPAGINEPTAAGVTGTTEILNRVRRLDAQDLCIALISGGGSALLPAPAAPVTLADKQQVTRFLAGCGATIQELNTVRAQLSLVKGGRLARQCTAGRLVSLIISDVIGDPLPFIASGPTVVSEPQPEAAWRILQKYDPDLHQVPPGVVELLKQQRNKQQQQRGEEASANVINRIVGSNRVALNAAAGAAAAAGFRVIDLDCENSGEAADHGRLLFERLQQLRSQTTEPVCVLAGGETTVQLNSGASENADASAIDPGKGGRNQEVVLAAVQRNPVPDSWSGLCLLSGGTDGEDGPTDAAGAIADFDVVQAAARRQADADSFLRRHDSWHFFQPINGLLQTGPTDTNVMDLAVGIVWPGKP